jgi:sterol O-acyltransferase
MSPVTSPTSPKAEFSFSSSVDPAATNGHTNGHKQSDLPSASSSRRRRNLSNPSAASTNLKKERSEIASIASAIESGSPLDPGQIEVFNTVLKTELRRLSDELDGKCTSTHNAYPSNLTVANWADWVCLPTLVYELEYPRQERINWL